MNSIKRFSASLRVLTFILFHHEYRIMIFHTTTFLLMSNEDANTLQMRLVVAYLKLRTNVFVYIYYLGHCNVFAQKINFER